MANGRLPIAQQPAAGGNSPIVTAVPDSRDKAQGQQRDFHYPIDGERVQRPK